MTILEMIKEWRKGCSCGPHNPANCPDCTAALIDAIERKLRDSLGGREDGASRLRPVIGGRGGNGGNGMGGEIIQRGKR